MKRIVILLVLVSMIFATAAADEAGLKYSGAFRIRTSYNTMIGHEELSYDEDSPAQSFTEIRFRPKFTYSFSDKIKTVFTAEIGDAVFGIEDKGAGKKADKKVVEVKNLYIDMMFNKAFNWKVGIMGVKDDFGKFLCDIDCAGGAIYGKLGSMKYEAGWYNWEQIENINDGSDAYNLGTDFIVVKGGTKMGDNKVGLNFFYEMSSEMEDDDHIANENSMWIAPYFVGKAGPVNTNFAFMYYSMGGDFETLHDAADLPNEDPENDGMALRLMTDMEFGDLTAGVNFLYTSAKADDGKHFKAISPDSDMGLELLGSGVNDNASLFGGSKICNAEHGIMLPIFHGMYKVNGMVSVGAAFGMAMATDVPDGMDEGMGSEFDIKANFKLLEKVKLKTAFAFFTPGDYTKVGDTEAESAMAFNTKLQWKF